MHVESGRQGPGQSPTPKQHLFEFPRVLWVLARSGRGGTRGRWSHGLKGTAGDRARALYREIYTRGRQQVGTKSGT
jgi:hypothetical protein